MYSVKLPSEVGFYYVLLSMCIMWAFVYGNLIIQIHIEMFGFYVFLEDMEVHKISVLLTSKKDNLKYFILLKQ